MNLRKEKKELLQYKILLSILSKRYKECNLKGHLNPYEEENKCNHCYRNLGNKSPMILRGLAGLVDELGMV